MLSLNKKNRQAYQRRLDELRSYNNIVAERDKAIVKMDIAIAEKDAVLTEKDKEIELLREKLKDKS